MGELRKFGVCAPEDSCSGASLGAGVVGPSIPCCKLCFVSRGGSPCWWGCNLRDWERWAGGTAHAMAPQHVPLLLPAPSALSPVLQHTCKGLGGSCVDLACVKTFSVVLYFNLDNISSNSPWSLKAHQAPHQHTFPVRSAALGLLMAFESCSL